MHRTKTQNHWITWNIDILSLGPVIFQNSTSLKRPFEEQMIVILLVYVSIVYGTHPLQNVKWQPESKVLDATARDVIISLFQNKISKYKALLNSRFYRGL